jgi:phosphatidate cytidylyltransferase
MLAYRIISGLLIGVSLLLAACYMPAFGILVLLLAISALGQFEFYSLLRKAGIPSFRLVGVACGSAMIAATFFTAGGEAGRACAANKWEHVVLVFSLIAVFIRQFPQKNNLQPLQTIGCTLLGIWYVPYLFNFFTRLGFTSGGTPDGLPLQISHTGRVLCAYLIVVVKCADIGAYFAGRAFGRHKLFPRISPAKTWEGLCGGIALSVLVSACFSVAGHGQLGAIALPVGHAVALGLFLSVVGVVGDMFESLLKRAASAKDSSSLIPGMGGVLDVLDSLLFGAPALYVYMKVFLV